MTLSSKVKSTGHRREPLGHKGMPNSLTVKEMLHRYVGWAADKKLDTIHTGSKRFDYVVSMAVRTKMSVTVSEVLTRMQRLYNPERVARDTKIEEGRIVSELPISRGLAPVDSKAGNQ